MKNIVSKFVKWLVMTIILLSCKKSEEPTIIGYVSGRVVNKTTNQPITEGKIKLFKDSYSTVYTIFDVNTNGEFNFQVTNKECKSCFFRYESPDSQNKYGCALSKLTSEDDSCIFSDHYMYDVFSKPLNYTLYAYPISNLVFKLKNVNPVNESDFLYLSIDNVANPPGINNTDFFVKGSPNPNQSYPDSFLYVFSSRTTTINYQIQKGGQTTNKSMTVVAEPFKPTTITIEY